MDDPHPVKQAISSITIPAYGGDQETMTVGFNGVTRIEATTKGGPYSDLPYVRVWAGDVALAEFCQHNITGVYFAGPEKEPSR